MSNHNVWTYTKHTINSVLHIWSFKDLSKVTITYMAAAAFSYQNTFPVAVSANHSNQFLKRWQ